ncbi:transcriptional regulator [Amycolatopsis sp. K13G38]|uniref:Transcriptional regulator n=1 Tax=Amycolatopsis acididurans TaxID=2724524 RepID=A0ABX1J3Y9_9PSEU|nr:transcriptional regulator [Amycolatopsis acididurans]NKQ54488.1 transcriptional regulator [Amycolatopsis acididurans]
MPDLPLRTETDLLVLHALRCIGFSSLAAVAAASGLDESTVESQLIDLAVAGLVTRVPGEFGGWGLTEAGRDADAERIAAELKGSGAWNVVAEAYSEFLELNPELLDLCTAWQTRDPADSARGARILEMFAEFDKRADEVCARLSGVLTRFARYRDRLAGALERAVSGEVSYLTDHTASYHTVWFQLHEDLLVTLGIPRH